MANDEKIAALNSSGPGGRLRHLPGMDQLHYDMHLISSWPHRMMHPEKPNIVVQLLHEEVKNVIHQQFQLLPDHFMGVCGPPQPCGEYPDMAIAELERCFNELSFKDCFFNPNHYENSTKLYPMGHKYCYPLHEKL